MRRCGRGGRARGGSLQRRGLDGFAGCRGWCGGGRARGGAVTAGIDALATGVPGEPDPVVGGVTEGGGGGGAEPTPNRDGEAVGEEGSASGADCAACCALVRSATSEAVSFFKASASGVSGLAGTVAMFGKG